MIRIVMFALTVLASGFFSNAVSAADNQCSTKAPKIECIEHIYAKTTLDRIGAAKICANGVTVECVEYMYSKTTLDRIGAAKSCGGGVSIECIEYMYSKTTLDRIGAAAACRGE